MMAEEKVVSMKEFEKEQKRRERKEKGRRKIEAIVTWFNDNRELALILIPAGIAGVSFLVKGGISITKGLIRTHNLKKEEALKDLYCYDRSLGHYWKLRRELTNNEWVEIDQRKKSGERLADILESLKVLA